MVHTTIFILRFEVQGYFISNPQIHLLYQWEFQHSEQYKFRGHQNKKTMAWAKELNFTI